MLWSNDVWQRETCISIFPPTCCIYVASLILDEHVMYAGVFRKRIQLLVRTMYILSVKIEHCGAMTALQRAAPFRITSSTRWPRLAGHFQLPTLVVTDCVVASSIHWPVAALRECCSRVVVFDRPEPEDGDRIAVMMYCPSYHRFYIVGMLYRAKCIAQCEVCDIYVSTDRCSSTDLARTI